MKKNSIMIICFIFFVLFIMGYSAKVQASTPLGKKIADAGAGLAVGIYEPYYAERPWTRVFNERTAKYVIAREKVSPVGYGADGGEYADCAVAVSTMVRYSGVDTEFPTYLCPTQWNYLNNNPKWQRAGIYYIGSATSYLRPGDVLIVDPTIYGWSNMHIWLYLGNESVQKYWPGHNADSIQASWCGSAWCSFYPTLFNASSSIDSRPYAIFRYDGVEEDPIDRSGGLKKEDFTCKMLCDPDRDENEKCILDYISQAYIIIEIIGVAFYLFMNIWSFTQAVASSTQDKFKKLGKKMIFRTFALLILLLLPIIIKSIFSLLKVAGVEKIIDFCIEQFL